MNWNNNPRIHRQSTHQNVNFVHMQEPHLKGSPHIPNKGNYQFSTQRDLITDLRSQLTNLKSQFSKLIYRPNEQNKTLQHPRLSQKYSFDLDETPKAAQRPKLQKKYTIGHDRSVNKECLKESRKELQTQSRNSSVQNQQKLQSSRVSEQPMKKPVPVNVLKTNKNKQTQVSPFKFNSIEVSKVNLQKPSIKEINQGPTKQMYEKQTLMKQLEKEKKASSIQENRIKQLQGLLQSQNKRHEEAIRNNEGRVIDLAKQLNNEKVKKGELQKQLETKKLEINQLKNENVIQIAKMSHQNEKKFQTRVQEEKLRIEKECENILNCERDKLNIEIKNLKEQNEKIVKNNHEEIGKYTKKIKIIEEESQKTTRLFEQMLAETQTKEKERFEKEKQVEIEKEKQKLRIIHQQRQKEKEQQKEKEKQKEREQLRIKEAKEKENKEKKEQREESQLKEIRELREEKEKMQQKLNVYLNNIDKLKGKISEQQNQIEMGSLKYQEFHLVIKDKDLSIKNMLKDIKHLEKQIHEVRRSKRHIQCLLEDTSEQLVLKSFLHLNEKYKIQAEL